MLYAILCYDREAVVDEWPRAQEEQTLAHVHAVLDPVAARGKLGPVLRLLPTTTATTLRPHRAEPLVLDGPFAETKEQLLGLYVVDCESLEQVIDTARRLLRDSGALEIRPLRSFEPGCAVQ